MSFSRPVTTVLFPERAKPVYTGKGGKGFGEFFHAEACALVRESRHGCPPLCLNAKAGPGQKILVHTAPIYPTTRVIIESMGL